MDHVAVIPFRIKSKKIEICIISSRRVGRWIVPKGRREVQKTDKEVALLEVWEEAGCIGSLLQGSWGTYEHPVDHINYKVKLYIMKVVSTEKHWPEKKQRKRRWVSVKKAQALVAIPGLQEKFNKLQKELIKRGVL
jgi:8-oxo-dGTP pyrophosphatase MutT (NUDIX family)